MATPLFIPSEIPSAAMRRMPDVEVMAAGGWSVMARMTIGAVGHLVKLHDTEGNLVGAMDRDDQASEALSANRAAV